MDRPASAGRQRVEVTVGLDDGIGFEGPGVAAGEGGDGGVVPAGVGVGEAGVGVGVAALVAQRDGAAGGLPAPWVVGGGAGEGAGGGVGGGEGVVVQRVAEDRGGGGRAGFGCERCAEGVAEEFRFAGGGWAADGGVVEVVVVRIRPRLSKVLVVTRPTGSVTLVWSPYVL